MVFRALLLDVLTCQAIFTIVCLLRLLEYRLARLLVISLISAKMPKQGALWNGLAPPLVSPTTHLLAPVTPIIVTRTRLLPRKQLQRMGIRTEAGPFIANGVTAAAAETITILTFTNIHIRTVALLPPNMTNFPGLPRP